MKRTFIYSALAAFLVAGAPFAHADAKKLEELKSKLTLDNSEATGPGIVSYAPALDKVMPTVVTISTSKSVKLSQGNAQQEELLKKFFDIPDDVLEQYRNESAPRRQETGLGSGVVISSDGYILTNNHVVAGADEITVTFPIASKEYQAEIVGADPRTDVALIKIDAKDLKAIAIGDSSKVRVGDVVFAVGSPLSLEQSASMGIVSALGRRDLGITNHGYENFIQTDAAINRGNSGGALVDASGRLVGINTAISSNFAGGNIGIGFAIPSNMALNIVERLLIGDGVIKRGFLGVELKEIDKNLARAFGRDNLKGVLVNDVGENTPAEKAGMQAGDLIVNFNGNEVNGLNRFRLDVGNTAPGTEVTFTVIRSDKEHELAVVLGDLEMDAPRAFAGGGKSAQPQELIEGVRVKDLDKDARTVLNLDGEFQGVVVDSVKDNAPAARAGLRPGMIITQIDQTDVTTAKEAFDLVSDFEGDVLLIQVHVRGRFDMLAVPLGGE